MLLKITVCLFTDIGVPDIKILKRRFRRPASVYLHITRLEHSYIQKFFFFNKCMFIYIGRHYKTKRYFYKQACVYLYLTCIGYSYKQ